MLSSSLDIIKKEPVILLPMLIEFVTSITLTHLLGLFFPQLTNSLLPHLSNRLQDVLVSLIAALAVGITLQPVVYGMYPLMVKNTVDKSNIDLRAAFRKAVNRYPSLLLALILVYLKVLIGTLLLILPGIYWLMGYYVTIPAVMLENRGGRDGMSASMSFSRNRKWRIFGLLLITSPPAYLGQAILRYFMNPVPIIASTIFDLTIGLVLYVLGVVMCSYTYIRYGMIKLKEQ